ILYGHYGDAIWGIAEAPQGLPELLEDPTPFMPKGVRGADIFIAVGIHPDILVALPEFLHSEGVKALIVPVENPKWASPGLEVTLREAAMQAHLEIAVPRPFCALEKGTEDDPTPTIDEFMDTFKIGAPEFYLNIENGRIAGGSVIRSQPCGAAYYILKQLYGAPVHHSDTSLNERISKAHHSYPCSASMDKDRTLNDTPLHMGGYIVRNAVLKAIQEHYKRKRVLESFPTHD
ncbi:MAG TPA: DUF166 family protein, partial [Candidatus Lokiarchaeia archaeon]|nr:DUF166 family protein [Candidatus Lokiarchaeia archaeon]